MEPSPSSDRNRLFQALKPCCVRISQLAIRETDPSLAARELLPLSRQILGLLEEQVQQNASVLDEKLAEYVFFPLFHIFRQVDQYPALLVEVGIRCLSLLILYGWKSRISPQLVQQILSFLVFILDGEPGSETKREISEETTLEALRALKALFATGTLAAGVSTGLAAPEAIPALGHGITVILEIVVDGATAEIQLEALSTLGNLYKALKDHAALASFLPGTVSSLTKVLSTPARYKSKVLARCLDTVCLTLTRVLGDLQTRSILAQAQNDGSPEAAEEKAKPLSPAWLKATTGQVRLALARIMKIRTHDSLDICDSLNKLCVTLLDECHTTLSDCKGFLVETSMMLDSQDSDASPSSALQTNLRDLAGIYPEITETIKATVYRWMTGLPQAMQSSDEKSNHQALRNLSKGLAIMKDVRIESSTLDELFSSTLRDTVVALISASNDTASSQLPRVQLITDGGKDVASSVTSSQLGPVLLNHQSQRRVKQDVLALIKSAAASGQQSKLAGTMLDFAREPTPDTQIAALWICFEVIKAAHQSAADDSALLDLSAFDDSQEDTERVFNDLYTYSVQILDAHTDLAPVDWRLEAIALEVAVHAAQRMGPMFRPELIDVLFPITTLLGSESTNLQQYAVVALNDIASACNYANVSELIIDNVDYMVNAVSLRLNTLDVSPATSNVLTMVIRLAGPGVVPFLDDVVDAIFTALENYHGYTTFVQNLFTVLKEAVNQGSRSDALLLEGQELSRPKHRKEPSKSNGLENLINFIDRREAQRKTSAESDPSDDDDANGHPTRPWKRAKRLEDDEGVDNGTVEKEEEKKPNSPTYQLLRRISTLTQYYLTSPAPVLRKMLLEILTTTSSALAADEDSFLPLVNDVWPVVIARLHDEESFVVIEACDALCHLCESAGDFLSSRFKTEWSEGLSRWCRRIKQQASGQDAHTMSRGVTAGKSSAKKEIAIPFHHKGLPDIKGPMAHDHLLMASGLGRHAAAKKIWDAVVKLLTAIVSFVRVDDGMFDEILDLLSDAMEDDDEVRSALENVNADAVWLARYERGLVEKMPPPVVDRVEFKQM